MKPTPEKAENERVEVETETKEIAKPVVAKNEEKESTKFLATQTGSGKGPGPGLGNGRAGPVDSLDLTHDYRVCQEPLGDALLRRLA